VILSSAGPVSVEVWNDTGSILLARQNIPSTNGIQTITVPVDVTAGNPATVYGGWGPFRAVFGGPPGGAALEVRVWTPGGGKVNVYSARLSPATAPAAGS
jgi:hypothetical protein